MRKTFFFLIALFCFTQTEAQLTQHSVGFEQISDTLESLGIPQAYQRVPLASKYVRHSHIDEKIWEIMSQHFLPEVHPLKPKLDSMFRSKRVTVSSKSLKKAGFKRTKPGNFSKTIVTQHENFKGYILKLFTDDQLSIKEAPRLYNRIKGAQSTRSAIEKFGYQHLFVVPQKWIYPLPLHPSPPPWTARKNFILIAEKLDILPKSHNYDKWKGQEFPTSTLDAVYDVLNEVGLWDVVFPFNMPLTSGGAIAFIDTEDHHRWPVPFHKLTKYLSPENKVYWENLIHNGGPKH